MPAEHHVDATFLDAVAAQLSRSSAAALEASHELLAHYGDTGDAPTQRALDTMIDHGADALRALTDSLADTSLELRAAALRACSLPAATLPAASWGDAGSAGSSARPGRRRRRGQGL